MSNASAALPPHISLLGEAMQPLLWKLEAGLSEPLHPTGRPESLDVVCESALGKLQDSIRRLAGEMNGALNELAGAAAPPAAEVHRAAGRLELPLDELLDGYFELLETRPDAGHQRGLELLVAVYRHTLTQLRDWLEELVEAIADPLAAVRRRGLPTSGKVNLDFFLTFTTARELGELQDWLQQKERRMRQEEAWAWKEERRAAARQTGSGFSWGAALVGLLLGGLFFGGDE